MSHFNSRFFGADRHSRRGGRGAQWSGDACVAHGGQGRSGRGTGRRATQGSPPFFPATPAPTRRIRFPARFSKYLPLRDFLASLLTVGKRGSVVAGMDIKPEGSANVPGEAFSPTHAIHSSIKKGPTHVNGLSRLHTRPLSQPA